MKISKKVLAVLLCMVLIVSMVGCKSSSDGAGVPEDRTFSYWIGVGEDSSYYTTYDENPVVKYLLSKTYGTDGSGNGKKIDLNFMVPVAGTQKESITTLVATGEYPDIFDMTYYPGTAAELYSEGITLDLTDYVEKYMPNYMAYMEVNPDFKTTATNMVDGESKILQLFAHGTMVSDMWGGYMYRRDWIVKYGTNPKDGSSFSGEFTVMKEDGTPDPDSWVDNVIFPSGGADPIYISDWEWMLDIFSKAIEDLGITDGYGMSLYYPGYFVPGDLVSGFGGGGPAWYKQDKENIGFGGNSDDFRAYLQCMNTWYKNGWIDKAFPEHATDAFYQVDQQKVFQGKVGLWYGMQSAVGGRLDDPSNPYLEGYVGASASTPINDIYGTAEQQNIEPYCMYQDSTDGQSIVISEKAKEKDLEALFTFFNYMCTPEGAKLKAFGFNKDQYEETKDELYTKNGLTEGAYQEIKIASGETRYEVIDKLVNDTGSLMSAVTGLRVYGVNINTERSHEKELPTYRNNMEQWIRYKNTGFISSAFKGQFSSENAKIFSKIETNVNEFMTKSVPTFIKGEKDPYNDGDWNAYVKAMSKYTPEKGTQIYQDTLDAINQK